MRASERNQSDRAVRLNAICPYYTMFPLSFPLGEIDKAGGVTRVLDPFCGRGTTLYAARLRGLPAVGIDINPVATAIAEAKLERVDPEAVVSLAKELVHRSDQAHPLPNGEFWDLCFEQQTLAEIVTIRNGLSNLSSPVASMLRAVMLGILHGPRNKNRPSYLSNQMPRTYASKPAYAVKYWKTRGLFPSYISVEDVISRRAHYLLERLPERRDSKVFLGDAVETLTQVTDKFDLVVTSPPYYGMRTYAPDQWLRSWFLGGSPDVCYETDGQLARQRNQDSFESALRRVWLSSSARCEAGSRLSVRFGALPSTRVDPEKLVIASLRDSGWLVQEVREAGTSPRKARQAQQFRGVGSAITEIDVIARRDDKEFHDDQETSGGSRRDRERPS